MKNEMVEGKTREGNAIFPKAIKGIKRRRRNVRVSFNLSLQESSEGEVKGETFE